MFTDLLGFPYLPPQPKATPVRRPVSLEAKRKKLLRHMEESNNLMLFDELLDFLKAPLLQPAFLTPGLYELSVVSVEDTQEDEEAANEERAKAIDIPYQPFGGEWIADANGLSWSRESLLYMQTKILLRSMDELGLSNNEHDKWSVLKWIFRPPIWKHYIYDKKLGRSHCLEVHRRDEPFSFHNCCIAARMDADVLREGVRRNVPEVVIKAVEKVCSFT